MRQGEVVPESAWDGLLKELESRRGCAIVLGATDSGKSTLVRYLIRKLIEKNISVSLVDSDVGQSSLGLPGTVSCKIFTKPSDLRHFLYRKMSFLGEVNPTKVIPLIVEKTAAMVKACKKESRMVLVDTSGLIEGEPGKALQLGKIRSVKPEHIIALQRGDELRPILDQIGDRKIHRLSVSSRLVPRNRAQRSSYRRRKLERYFSRASLFPHSLEHGKITFFYHGRPKVVRPGAFVPGAVIGLNHDGDTVALGVLREITVKSTFFTAPRKSMRGINGIVLGGMVFELL